MTTTVRDEAPPAATATRCLATLASVPTLAVHEDETRQHPYDVERWLVYLEAVDDWMVTDQQSPSFRRLVGQWIGQRALCRLPRSYKLWKRHWEFLVDTLSLLDDDDDSNDNDDNNNNTTSVVVAFERALVTLSAYPRVWVAYIDFLRTHPGCCSVTHVRRTVNRALQTVAIAQHEKVWPGIVEWFGTEPHDDTTPTPRWTLPLETRVRILQRYVTFQPRYGRDLCDFLGRHGLWGQAAVAFQRLWNANPASTRSVELLATDSGSSSAAAVTTHTATTARNDRSTIRPDLDDTAWADFCRLVTTHPVEVQQAGVPWEAMLRAVLPDSTITQSSNPRHHHNNNTHQHRNTNALEALVWTSLADAWIRQGLFDLARSVYEEGLQKVHTIRDFSILYNAYLTLEEGLLEAAVATVDAMEDDTDEHDTTSHECETTSQFATLPDDADDWDILLGTSSASQLADMELAVARAEHLTSRRPLLLNAVLLRQNPHHVGEWLERAKLYQSVNQPGQATATLEEALRTVVANKAVHGRPSELVAALSNLYETVRNDAAAARSMLERICVHHGYAFAKTDDLAECWATWVELELKQEAWDDALLLARQAVAAGSGTRKLHLTQSLRLWDLLLDLEESLGTTQTTKDAYNRALEIKAATVQHVLNYGTFLTEQKYFEESFTAYERGIELFAFPHAGAKLLWKAYLEAFLDRYQGTKVERARDLFQRCLEACPAEDAADFYMMNGEFEETYGLTRRALSVYRAMCHRVPKEERLVAYQLYVAKTIRYLGVTATRDIYQEAIENLADKDSSKLCVEFAKMETGLEQLDRARAIFTYGAQMADPRRLPEYWKTWNEFEIAHGNEETFREMLRVKRSVEAAFSTVNYNATGMTDKVANLSNEEAMQMIASQEGVEVGQTAVSGFVPSSNKRSATAASLDDVEAKVAKLRKATGATQLINEERDDIGEDGDEIDIDDIDAEIEEAAAEGAASVTEPVTTNAVPPAVFGGLANEAQAQDNVGALDRLRAAAAAK
jgi:pre-mRNA-splicing factor SYF1